MVRATRQRANGNSASLIRSRRSRLAGAVVATLFVLPMLPSLAQEAIGESNSENEPQTEVSHDEWLRRVEEAKQRAKAAALERRNHPELFIPVPEDPERIATERALNDDSLQPGDIVSTKQGLFVFRGRSDQPRKDDDFVPIPSR